MATELDGSTDWYSHADDTAYRLTRPFCWFVWVKSDTNANLVIMEKGNNINSVFSDVGGIFNGVTAAFAQCISLTDIMDDTWNCLSFCAFVDNSGLDYSNGFEDTSVTDNSLEPSYGAAEFTIGARTGGSFFFPADMYFLTTYDREITAVQQAALFRGANPFGFGQVNILYPFIDETGGIYGPNGDLVLTTNGTPVKAATNPPIEMIENYLN